MAKILSFLVFLFICSILVSGCLGKWRTCQANIPWDCNPAIPTSCVNICGSSVGGDLLTDVDCRRIPGSGNREAHNYCECYFSCPPAAAGKKDKDKISPVAGNKDKHKEKTLP